MATVPLSGTNIRLLSNVPFSNDYKNTRWFDTKASQENYFTSKPVVHSMSQANFQRIDGYHYVAVNKNIDDLWGTNYLMFQNAQYNNKWFYAFVTKLEYVQKNTTKVYFQIDVFQTWKFDMNFKPSFVVREHCKLWDADGSPVINTIDEGLNYGCEYDTVYAKHFELNEGYRWLVMVTKTPVHTEGEKGIDPSYIGVPQPLSYYVVPFKDNKTPTILLGSNDYVVTQPTRILKELYTNEKATNNIVSLFVTEHIGLSVDVRLSSGGTPDVMTINHSNATVSSVVIQDSSLYMLHIKGLENFNAKVTSISEDKYASYTKPKESKLLMYPYTVLVLDDFRGSRMEYKNEYIEEKGIKITTKGSLGVTNKVSYGIDKYSTRGTETVYQKTNNEHALFNTSSNDIPIINDMLTAFLQGNKNSIENQKSSILFNGSMNVVSNGLSMLGSLPKNPVAPVDPLALAQGAVNMTQGVGNTVLELQGIEAKQQDIANMPPQIGKMGSNTSYDYGNGYSGIWVIKKQIKPEYQEILGNFFNMFGYKVNRVKTPNFHTRKYWNYVETKNCNITGNFNNNDLQELKAVFDNGITFWHTDDIGNYSLENEVL